MYCIYSITNTQQHKNFNVYDSGTFSTIKSKKEVRTIDSLVYLLYKSKDVGRPNYDSLRKAAINDSSTLLAYTNQV